MENLGESYIIKSYIVPIKIKLSKYIQTGSLTRYTFTIALLVIIVRLSPLRKEHSSKTQKTIVTSNKIK